MAVVAAGLALRLSIAWLDMKTLVMKVLPDDAFYYFETAHRISHGQNVAFDGSTLSNGYHPLWLFFLVPIYLLPGHSLPIHLALTASSLFDVGAAILVAITVWKLTQKPAAALFALTFYLLLPQNVFAAVNGVESGLAALMVAALLLTVTVGWREEQAAWVRWSVITGSVGGLMVLARLDTALLLLVALGLIALFQPSRTRWRAPLLIGAISFLLVAPWFLWSAVAAGGVAPVSAQSSTFLARQVFLAIHPDASSADQIRHGLSYARYVLETRAPYLYFPARPYAVALLTGAAGLSCHYLLFCRGPRRRIIANQALVAGLPMVAFLAMLIFNSAYRWSVREWYFAWGMPAVACVAGVLFAYFDDVMAPLTRFRGRQLRELAEGMRGLVLYGLLVTFLVLAYVRHAQDTWRNGHYPFQRDSYEAALFLRSNTAPDDKVASFNAGVIGYFSDRTVVNIDGVVNPDAYQALREHRLLAYLRDADVTYAADYDMAWRGLPGFAAPQGDWSKGLWGEDPNLSFVTVKRIGLDGFFGQMRILRRTQ